MIEEYESEFTSDASFFRVLEHEKEALTEAMIKTWKLQAFNEITAIDPFVDVTNGRERSSENTPPGSNVEMGEALFGDGTGICVPTYDYAQHGIDGAAGYPTQMNWEDCGYFNHVVGGGFVGDKGIECSCNFADVLRMVETFATQEVMGVLARTNRCYPDEDALRLDTAIAEYEAYAQKLGAGFGESGGSTEIDIDLAEAKNLTEEWNGEAGDAFTENVLQPAQKVHLYNRDIAIGLQRTAVAKKGAVQATRMNAINLLRAGTVKCGEVVEVEVSIAPKDGWRVISIAGTIYGFLSGFTISGVLGLVSTLEAWNVADAKTETVNANANKPSEIIAMMTADFDTADQEADAAEGHIESGLEAIVAAKSELTSADLQLTDHNNDDWW